MAMTMDCFRHGAYEGTECPECAKEADERRESERIILFQFVTDVSKLTHRLIDVPEEKDNDGEVLPGMMACAIKGDDDDGSEAWFTRAACPVCAASAILKATHEEAL